MPSQTIRYSLLRLLTFLACLLLLWLVGLKDPLWLLLAAATVSMLISLFAFAGMRERMSAEVAQRVEDRRERSSRQRRSEVLSDEEAEDLLAGDPDDGRGSGRA